MTSSTRLTILIVDDDDALRRSLARALATSYDVVQAADGIEAVAILDKQTFDAIVTDLDMPRMGGDELVAWLATNQPDVALRVVVVTGGARRESQATWLNGFRGRVLVKPVEAAVVSAAVEAVARGGRNDRIT
jgi:CheY-like chemotaxis protein